MPITSTPDKIPAPAGSEAASGLAQYFQDMASSIQAVLSRDRASASAQDDRNMARAAALAADARAHAEDAHKVNGGTVQGSSTSAQAVTTNGAGVGGLSYGIPAGYGASFNVIFDVRCTSFVAGSVFLGTMNIIDRRTNTPSPINGQAPFEATAARQRTTTGTANSLSAVGYDRTLQAIVAKTDNGGYEITPGNCRLQVTLLRTGSA